ncbi:MAG: hypothetical protein ACP5N2_01605 [Candidatus Nanoarchaeia archaeon]
MKSTKTTAIKTIPKTKSHLKFRLKLFILIIVSISIFIAGCNGGGNNPKIVNVYTGTQGVTVQFTQNNPPVDMYEDSEVIVLAEIWNKGAFTPSEKDGDEPIMVSLNVDKIYFDVVYDIGDVNTLTGLKDYLDFYLSGKSEVWPVGEKTIIPIARLKVNKIPGIRETPTTKIGVSACYPYKTYFAQSICVDTDMYDIEKDPICKNLKTYTYPGQGAPIIVSKLEVDMVPVRFEAGQVGMSIPIMNESGQFVNIGQGTEDQRNLVIRPYFRIYFTNVENGILMSFEKATNPCVVGPSSRGEALIVTASLGNMPLTCAKPEIKLYSNEGSVRCWLNETDVSGQFELNRNYELPLKIEAEYFYKVTSTKDVKINRVS